MSDFVVLTVDDDPTQLELVNVALMAIGSETITHLRAETLGQGLAMFTERHVDLVIADYLLPDGNGLELLDRVKEINPLANVLIITGHQSVDQAVSAMKRGADDYLVKPIDARYLKKVVDRYLANHAAPVETAHLAASHPRSSSNSLVFRSAAMSHALDLALRGARSNASVLIRGESGTGKELFARLIHDASPRRDAPFVAVNVAALSESLVESELFGHTKGAFTGASAAREGRFQAADGGTLFLDELAEIPLSVQVKLLRAVQFRQVEPVGGDRPVDVDVRIVAATHRDLEQMVADRSFRDDLYYRLNVISVAIPPLRARKTDIPALVEHIIERIARETGSTVRGITPAAMDFLVRYDYPGNVRELENIVERAIVLARGEVITEPDLPDVVTTPAASTGHPADRLPVEPLRVAQRGLDEQLARFERSLIVAALDDAGGNQSTAARRLGIGERRLRSRMQLLEIENVFRAE